MKVYGGVDVNLYIFLTSALVGDEWLASRLDHFTPDTHSKGGLMGPISGLDDGEKRKFLTLLGLELRLTRHPARSQSLYNWYRAYFPRGKAARA
jgi:hypothetical protein